MILFPAPPPETLAKLLDALDTVAKQATSTVALVLRFPDSVHLVYVNALNRAVTIGRLLFAGGEPLGFIGLRRDGECADPFYCFLPEIAGQLEAREQLRALSFRLCHECPAPSLLSVEVPNPRPTWRESAETLFGAACHVAAALEQPCRLIFASEMGPAAVSLQGTGILAAIARHLDAQDTPVGVLGMRPSPDGSLLEVAYPLSVYGKAPWASRYIEAVQTTATRLRWLGAKEIRPVLGKGVLGGLSAPALLERLAAADQTLREAALVIVLDEGASIACKGRRAERLSTLLAAGGTPVGILGWSLESGHVHLMRFAELRDEPWAEHYLTGVAEALAGRGALAIAA
jgi:hypothetical protein